MPYTRAHAYDTEQLPNTEACKCNTTNSDEIQTLCKKKRSEYDRGASNLTSLTNPAHIVAKPRHTLCKPFFILFAICRILKRRRTNPMQTRYTNPMQTR